MQKLTILILITLILSSFLCAEEASIILDRDIIYWSPSEPDIQIPDTYFSPELFQYGEDAFRSTLFYPFPKKPNQFAPKNEESILSDEELLLKWTPPALFKVEELKRPYSFTGYTSFPYGSGVILKGSAGLFYYRTTANYAHSDRYSHWIAADAGVKSNRQDFKTQFAWRSLDDFSLLSLINWDLRSAASERGAVSLRLGLQSILPLDSFKSSEDDNSLIGESHQWKGNVVLAGDVDLLELNIATALSSEYRRSVDESSWRFTPELLFSKNYSGRQGDLNLKAGIIADINGGGKEHQYFPQLHIDFINYGNWSTYLDSRSSEVEDSQIHRFLSEEVYYSPETAFYRFHLLETGFFIIEDKFQIALSGGYSIGMFPDLQQELLTADRKSLYFIDSSIRWNYRAGKVTELNCYADYQDRGSFRFFLESRWQGRKTEEKTAFSLILRAGNRELLRGYRYFFNDSSDLITGSGLELDFVKPLQAAVYLDYLPQNRSLEGRIELCWLY